MATSASLRGPSILAAIFLIIAIGFSGFYFIAERISPDLALKRFESAMERGSTNDALGHGERALALYEANETDPTLIFDLRSRLARAHISVGNYEQAAILLTSLLTSQSWQTLAPMERLPLEKDLAITHILAGDFSRGMPILSSFLELAGNAAMVPSSTAEDNLQTRYASAVYDAGDVFARAFRPALGSFSLKTSLAGDSAEQLAIAAQMVDLGAYYSLQKENLPAASGLLSAAYIIRQAHLPEHARDLTQIALILGPIYLQSKRYEDAETLYLSAFHAQEKLLGNSSIDTSLYLKYLTSVYRIQGRTTEANALAQHMHTKFQENYGGLRHSLYPEIPQNLVRPVSQTHTIPANYQPSDLVGASSFLIPVKALKGDGVANDITLSLAGENIGVERNANMPVRLAQLMTLCSQATRDEVLSLARGFRAQSTDTQITTASGLTEHQLGLAIDLNVNGRLMRQSDASWLCFRENAWKSGFILSWPQGNLAASERNSFEPWHWRYVGIETARLYREYGPLFQPQAFLADIECYREFARSTANQPFLASIQAATQCVSHTATQNRLPAPQNLIAPPLKPGSVNPTQTDSKALRQALQYGPALVKKGRLEEAGTLFIAALKSSDKMKGSSSPDKALLIGMLSERYHQGDMKTHSSALSMHMTEILRNAYDINFAVSDIQSEGINPTKALNKLADITRPVSQHFILHADYHPADLVAANTHGIPVSKDPSLDEMKLRLASENNQGSDLGFSDIATLPKALSSLIDSCSAQIDDEAISLRSGYRAYQTQVTLYQRLRHRGTVTPPGMSEHQTGLAADIDVNGKFMREDDKAFSCFIENAHHYGFILSYPKGNQYLPGVDTFEPWHWRYVGIETAQLYKKHGPEGKPQEFLAALHCYRDQAKAREQYFPSIETDYCLYENISGGSNLPSSEPFSQEAKKPDRLLTSNETPKPAQNLNKVLRSGQDN